VTARPLRGTLFVDDALPRSALGAGHPAGLATLRVLAALSERVLVVPTMGALGDELPADPLPPNVEVGRAPALDAVVAALATPEQRFDLLWVHRPNNMASVADLYRANPSRFAGVRIVYHAEAIFAQREIGRRQVAGTPLSMVQRGRLFRRELYPVEIAHAVATVCAPDRDLIASQLRLPVVSVGYPAHCREATPGFAGRRGAVFVGALSPAESPNGDSLRFLFGEVWKHVDQATTLRVAGRGSEPGGWLSAIAPPRVELLGTVGALDELFDAARVFIAPTRYGAGIPLKVVEAACHGVPVVGTSLIAHQLGWRDGRELAVADEPAAMARAIARLQADETYWNVLREGAKAAVRRDFAPQAFIDGVTALACGDPAQRAGESRRNSQATPATTSIVAQSIAPT
jgi:O-antigen biosynthesis protein